jgi:hypothetical protein
MASCILVIVMAEPVANSFSDIAKRMKEIESERAEAERRAAIVEEKKPTTPTQTYYDYCE